MSTSSDPPPRAPRSQFLQKLHGLLEHPLDSTGLRWVTDDSFEVSSKDAVAIHALSPVFEFNSLSSFIRQLSYYSFRRLSDRRRSTERRNSNTGYILFTQVLLHLSPVWLLRPRRPLEAQPDRPQTSEPAGEGQEGQHDVVDSVGRDARHLRAACGPASSGLDEYARVPATTILSADVGQPSQPQLVSCVPERVRPVAQLCPYDWRMARPEPRRRLRSLFCYAAPVQFGRFKLAAPTFSSGLPGVQESRPPLRKAASSLTVQTHNLVPQQPYFQPASEDCQPGFRSSPYPTPTFSPTTNTFFPATNGSAHDYHAAPAAGPAWTPAQHVQQYSHVAYDPSPFPPAYQPIAPTKVTPDHDQLSYHTPSPDASPHLVGGSVVASNNYLLGNQASVGGGGYSQVSALSSSPSRTYFSTQQQPAWSPAPIRTSYV